MHTETSFEATHPVPQVVPREPDGALRPDEVALVDAPAAGERTHATLVLDWDRERYAGAVPRRVPLPTDDPGPTWLAFPHQRYVVCARHRAGIVELVYVTSLVGKRDSLIPAGAVERVVTDAGSVTVVVEGRPYLYAVDSGTTLDLTHRKVLGATGS